MALRKGQVSIRLGRGVDTSVDEKTAPATSLLVLENGVFTRKTSIVKRNGYETLSRSIEDSASEVTGAIRLGRRGSELVAFTLNRCYSHQPTADQWSDVGAVFSVVGTDRPAVRTGTQQAMPDHATNDGVSVYAWEDSRGGVWWTTVDAASGRVHRAPTQADADGQRPRCVAVGNALHIYYANATLGRVYILVVNPSVPSAAVTPAILVDDLKASNPAYDACPTSLTGTPAAIAWIDSASGGHRVGYVDASGALGSPSTGWPSIYTDSEAIETGSPIAVAHHAESEEIAVARIGDADAGGIVTFYTTDTTIVDIGTAEAYVLPVSVQRIALEYDEDGVVWAAFEEAAAAASNRFTVVNSATSALVVGTERTIRSVGLASRAFAINGEVFATFVHDTTYFNVFVALRLSDFVCVARQLPGQAVAPSRTHLSSAHVVHGEAAICLPYRERVISENSDKFTETGLRLVRLDFESEDSHITAEMGRSLFMAGACPQAYDGRSWAEYGFHVGPELIATVSAAGGSMTVSSTYLYRAWYEWTNAQGEIERGPTSFGTTVVTGASDTQVTLTLPTLRITAKSNVRICVARSLPGATAALWRVSSLDPSATGANGYIANSTSTDTVTFIDRLSDVNLQLQDPLYTTGGILSNDPTSLGAVMAAGKNRLFFSDQSDGNVIRYTQEVEDGGYLPEVAPELTLRCDPYGGDVTGLAVMDGALIIFKESAIMDADGNGPTSDGGTTQTGFTAPRLLPGDVGCTDPNSIAMTPIGVVFKSAKGLRLLDRSRQIRDIGDPVDAYTAQSVRRATVMLDRPQVVFLTDDGLSLLFDWSVNQWSTFTNHEGRDAQLIDGVYHYLRTDERVFRETPGVYSDAGRSIRLRMETAWIHLQEQLQGFQRLYHLHLLGERKSAHQLVVQVRTNYLVAWCDPMYLDATGAAAGATGWITGSRAGTIGADPITGSSYGDGAYGAGPYGGTTPQIYQKRIHLGVVCQAVQFRFEDFEADGYAGASFELSEMLITGGIKGPANKPFSAARSS